jgi:hypothetical protein
VLQELMVLLTLANSLAEEIAARFARGDAAEALVSRLAAETRIIARYVSRIGNEMTDECRKELARLQKAVEKSVGAGGGWLEKSNGPELAAINLRHRVSRAYGLIPSSR